MQASDVVGDGLDLAVIQLCRHTGHRDVVFTNTAPKANELRFGVISMLTSQAGVLDRQAGTVRAVATCAGGNAAFSDTAAVNLYAQRGEILVFRKARLGLLAAVKRSDVLHVVFAQGGGNSRHDGVCAFARFVFGQLLGQIFGMLSLQDRVRRASARTVGGVARNTDIRRCRLTLDQIGFENSRPGWGGRSGSVFGLSGKYRGDSDQQAKDYKGNRLHVAQLFRVQNRVILQ